MATNLTDRLNYIVIALVLAAAIAMGYGIYRFPDAPIRQCGENCFQGKQGQPRSQADFEAFNTWLIVAPALVVLSIALGFVAHSVDRRRRMRENTENGL